MHLLRLLLFSLTLSGVACARPPAADACEDPLGCLFLAPDAPLEIGIMLTTTGDTGFLGRDALGAIDLVLEEEERSWLGHPLVLRETDGSCSAAGGEAAALDLINNRNLVAIIGPSCAATARAALPAINEAGLILISPSATGPELTSPSQEGRDAFLRTVHNDLWQGEVAARYARDVLRATTAATIYARRSYSTDLQQAFADTFQDNGGNIVFQGALEPDESNLDDILNSIAADSADVLYLPLFEPEANNVVRRAVELPGLADTVLLSADSIFVDGFPENTGPAASGVRFTAPYLRGAAYNAFLASWVAAYEVLPAAYVHAFAYDAMRLLLNGVAETAVAGPDGSLTIGRQALRTTLRATTSFPGLTGNLTCRPDGECADSTVFGIYQIGEAEILEGRWPPPVIWSP